MSAPTTTQRQLGRLLELQQLQLDRQQAELVAQQQLCQRVQGTVQRLEALGAHASLAGTQLPGLAQNSAVYKQAMLAWADQQRQELVRRQAELAQAQAQALESARRQASLKQLLSLADARALVDAQRREQKRDDEVATQALQNGAGSARSGGAATGFGGLAAFGPTQWGSNV
ncbi:hypothetical protein OU995_12900 [Roseateles sp. SL47]|uniref:hypothetical protein n=1 Tax=Roseateles sp. SL47 TaxID=2995138 RepID=UPI00226D85A6|nr:hypothetical protein [Roseateles sp. SL47]WAC75538.1 hypothetical protein OU995_12900 [Roseateles sp. SL47]